MPDRREPSSAGSFFDDPFFDLGFASVEFVVVIIGDQHIPGPLEVPKRLFRERRVGHRVQVFRHQLFQRIRAFAIMVHPVGGQGKSDARNPAVPLRSGKEEGLNKKMVNRSSPTAHRTRNRKLKLFLPNGNESNLSLN